MNINFQLMSFCTAQKIERPFGISNAVSIIVCTCVCGWLVFDLKVGIYVFSIQKMIIELINLAFIIYAFVFKIEKGS